MKKIACLTFAVAAVVALPAGAEWELIRGNEQQRLLVDPKSIKSRGAETSFNYLVDFREMQGPFGGKYRSIVVGAALRCKERRIAMKSFELYTGNSAQGVLLAQPEPKAAEKRFTRVEKGSSDEDLHRRICEKGPKKK